VVTTPYTPALDCVRAKWSGFFCSLTNASTRWVVRGLSGSLLPLSGWGPVPPPPLPPLRRVHQPPGATLLGQPLPGHLRGVRLRAGWMHNALTRLVAEAKTPHWRVVYPKESIKYIPNCSSINLSSGQWKKNCYPATISSFCCLRGWVRGYRWGFSERLHPPLAVCSAGDPTLVAVRAFLGAEER